MLARLTLVAIGILLLLTPSQLLSYTDTAASAPPLTAAGPAQKNVRICVGNQTCAVGYVSKDERADLIAFTRTNWSGAGPNEVWVAHSDGLHFERPVLWKADFCQESQICQVGDVDLDQRADAIAFARSTNQPDIGRVYVAFAKDGPHVAPQIATYLKNNKGSVQPLIFCVGNETCLVGDIDHDDDADLVAFSRNADPSHPGAVWVAKSRADEAGQPPALFTEPIRLNTIFCIGEEECALGEMDSTPGQDMVAFMRSTQGGSRRNDVRVLSTKVITDQQPVYSSVWNSTFCVANERCLIGDFGPGAEGFMKRDDLLSLGSFMRADARIPYAKIALNEGNRFSDEVITFEGRFCIDNQECFVGDMDGDSRDDIIAIDRSVSARDCRSNTWVTYLRTPVPLPEPSVHIYLSVMFEQSPVLC